MSIKVAAVKRWGREGRVWFLLRIRAKTISMKFQEINPVLHWKHELVMYIYNSKKFLIKNCMKLGRDKVSIP